MSFFENKFFIVLLISIIIDNFGFLRCFSDILHKYKFYDERVFPVTAETLNIEDTILFNSLSAIPTKWSNTLKQFFGNLPTNCLSVFDHFVKLALKGLRTISKMK